MLGSVMMATVCLQTPESNAVQELSRFRWVAAKPEWSLTDLKYLGSALTSQFEQVRNAALEFWPARYPDAWEDFRFLVSYDYEKSDTFWSSVVEPGYNQLIRQPGSSNWLGAVRSLLKFGDEPGPRSIGCPRPGPRGTEWSETLAKTRYESSPDFLRLVYDKDPLVCYNAVNEASSTHDFMRSGVLRSWLESDHPGRMWAAINNYETSTTAEWVEVTKLLLLSHDETVRRAAIRDEYKHPHDQKLVLNLVASLPDYAYLEGMLLVLSGFDGTEAQVRSYVKQQLGSPNAMCRLLAASNLTQTPDALSETELRQLAESPDLPLSRLAIEALEKRGIEPTLDWQDRLWKLEPSRQLDKVTVNTAKPPPDWALKKYIDAIESGSEGWFLEEEFAAIVSRSLPLISWIESGRPSKVRTALRMIPQDRVNDFSQQIQKLVFSADSETSELALSRAAHITIPAVRYQLFEMLSKLKGEAQSQFREDLCEINDPVSRKFLDTWRTSSNREERMFARRTLYFRDRPRSDD